MLALHPRPAVPTPEGLRLASISLSPPGASLSLNATVEADLAIRNPSPVAAFTHDAGLAEVYYRGALAADADLPPGCVGAAATEAMTVRFAVLADRLAVSAAQLYGDLVGAGDVPLTVRTAVPGTVVTVCDVAVSVGAPGAQTSSCRYRTKFYVAMSPYLIPLCQLPNCKKNVANLKLFCICKE